MKKKSKVLLTLALAFIMCFAGMQTAFAVTINGNGALQTEPGNEVSLKAAITKILNMPEITNVPAANFVFKLTPMNVDGTSYDGGNMPSIGPIAINFSSGAEMIDPAPNPREDSWYKESGDIFNGITFSHAGVYVYEVTENANTNTPGIDTDVNHQKLTYSEAKYTLTVYVANNGAGDGTYIYGLGTAYTVKDDGVSPGGVKVDPTPGGNGSTTDYSQMIFNSTYVKTNGPTDPSNFNPADESDSTLIISKEVDGGSGNEEEYFNFSITLDVPALATNVPVYYNAYVVDGGVVVVNSPANNVAGTSTQTGTDTNGGFIKVSTAKDQSTDFKLRGGQKLVFVANPVGTGYKVTESASDHAPSFIITTGGQAAPKVGVLAENPLDTGNQLVGEGSTGKEPNIAAFTNYRDFITPMGLSINDLPFIGLILIAAGALAIFIAVKSRKREGYGS